MAATLGVMQSAVSMAALSSPSGSWATHTSLKGGMVSFPLAAPKRATMFRCQAGETPSSVREAVDKATKKEITKEDIFRHQESDESEKNAVFGTKPAKGSFYRSEENPQGAAGYPRPEIERRPETGDRSFGSIFAFDGAAPETINGRLAMLGFVWAFLAEKATGLTVAEQVFSPGTTGQIFFIAMVQVFAYASLVPIINGESTDARSWGPFNAKAERWNGRLAMIGFAALLIAEFVRQGPVFN
ncbi:unnamed protein product [Calypogeia fissa]